MGDFVYKCEWPKCNHDATSLVKRGERMKYIKVCVSHIKRFRELSNSEAQWISDNRRPTRKKYVIKPYFTNPTNIFE